jgi:hypothetical protein
MPSFLHDVEIDWGWPRLSDAERAIARRHEALLQADRQAHTVETAEQALAAAGRDLPGHHLRMRAIDDDTTYSWQVVDGEVFPGHEFDEGGMFPGESTAEDFRAAGVTVVRTPLAFPVSTLREIHDRGWERDASLSTLVQGAWQTAADEVPPGFRMPGGPRRMQSVYLPIDIWADIKDRAKTEERSMSYLVQRAVTAAYELPVE